MTLSRRTFLAAVAGLILVAGCSKKKTDEELIREVIDQAIAGANEKRPGRVVENALESFKGPRGADLRECRRIITGYLLQQGWLRVFKRSLDIKVDGDGATAKLEAVLARGNPVENLKDVLPTNASVMEFSIALQRTEDGWKLASADYRQLAL